MTLHFVDNARLAALSLLDSPFGERLRELATHDPERWSYADDRRCLQIGMPRDPWSRRRWISSGEVILSEVLASLAHDGQPFHLADLAGVDEVEFDRVMAALLVAHGRVEVSA